MEKYKSKVDIIYDLLMTDIAKGVYRQDDRLVISQIARQNNVSDIPVREALRRLESEGYVKDQREPGRDGVRVQHRPAAGRSSASKACWRATPRA